MTRQFWNRAIALAAILTLLNLGRAAAVEYANINVADGAVAHSDPPTATIPVGQGTSGFAIDSGAVVGEIPVIIGGSAADDAAGGVLITSVTEFEHTTTLPDEILYASTSVVADDDATSTNTRNTSGGLAIVTDRAGSNVAPGSNFTLGAPMNTNVAAAYFAFSDGWQGQNALGTTMGASLLENVYGPGDHVVRIDGVEDARRQGILLATTAVNKNHFSVVVPRSTGDGFSVSTGTNAGNGGARSEDDPVSYVFVPLGTPGVTMGSIYGEAGQFAQPHANLASGSPFTVERFELPAPTPSNPDAIQHRYRLSINGESPTSGTLLLQSSGFLDGDGGNPGDNLITYHAEGNDWIIVSDDLPTANGVGQNGGGTGSRQPYFQFVFLPFDAQPTGPAPIPQLNFTKESVIGFDADVIELVGGDNDNNDGTVGMYVDVPTGTAGVEFFGLRTNQGDNSVSADGMLPVDTDGVMFATVSEGLRDNSATGGLFEYGTIGVSITGASGGAATWEFHTGAADPGGGEHNINFAGVLFGADSGFVTQAQQPVSSVTGALAVSIPDVNSQTDGVLMAVNYGNDYQFVTVTPTADGSGWDLVNSNDSAAPVGGDVNTVFLPYTTQNLVAGRVNADGSLVNSTDTGAFTLTKDATGEYLLTIAGRTPDQGMLLLNATSEGAGFDNQLVYEPDGNSFRIIALDMITQLEEDGGGFVTPEDTSFSFAFIDFVTAPTLGGGEFLEADFNEDGVVDGTDLNEWKTAFGTSNAGGDADEDGDTDGADFLTWQMQLGTNPAAAPAAAAVPEPGSIALAMLAGMALYASRRR